MKPALDTFLYWSLMVLLIPGCLAMGVWFIAALSLRKPLQTIAATLMALTLACATLGVRSLHLDHLRKHHASAGSTAWGERTLAVGVAGVIFWFAAQRREAWGPGPNNRAV